MPAIKNFTKNFIITKQAKPCKSLLSHTIGLMFSKPRTLLFIFNKEKKISIHMFFVFFPIDIIFLDKNLKVIEIKRNLKPFQLYFTRSKAKYIIELPLNNIKNTEINDQISFFPQRL